MLNEEIKVTENEGKTVTVLTLEDCEKYHGLKRYGGLALCFRVMKFALDRLVPEGEAARRKLITFKTAFDGPGITDSAELIDGIEAPECIWGKLYFEVRYGKKLMKISVRDGIISPEFLAAGRKFYSGTATPQETEIWIGFKGKLYDAVVNSKLEDILKTEIVG